MFCFLSRTWADFNIARVAAETERLLCFHCKRMKSNYSCFHSEGSKSKCFHRACKGKSARSEEIPARKSDGCCELKKKRKHQGVEKLLVQKRSKIENQVKRTFHLIIAAPIRGKVEASEGFFFCVLISIAPSVAL